MTIVTLNPQQMQDWGEKLEELGIEKIKYSLTLKVDPPPEMIAQLQSDGCGILTPIREQQEKTKQ